MSYEERSKNAAAGRQEVKRPHNIAMEDRRKLSVSGVEDVESFDEHEIVMLTVGGCLTVKGEGLSISRLSVDSGDVNIQGTVVSLCYEETAPSGSLWSRLFR